MNKITRMELLRLKKERALLIRSINLLKDKRDSLLGKIMDAINESKKKYNSFSKAEDELINNFKDIFLRYNTFLLRIDSVKKESFFNISKQILNFLNIKWAVLKPEFFLDEFESSFYFLKEEDIKKLRESIVSFLMLLCPFASLVNNIAAYLNEVYKLTRRINYLEKSRLPQFESDIRKLQTMLDELEREELIRYKKIKEKKNSKKI